MTQNTVRKTKRVLIGAAAASALGAFGAAAGTTMAADAADPSAAIGASPSPLTFDDVAVGTSKVAVVTLKSTGSAPAILSGVANVGRDASQYSIAADDCTGKTLAPGSTCAVRLTFTPKSPKTLVTNLRFSSSNACTAYVTVAGGGTTAQRSAETRGTPRAGGCNIVTTTTPGAVTTVAGPTVTTTATTPGSTQTSAASSSPSPAPGTSTTSATGAVAGVIATSPKVCKSRRTITFNVKPRSGQTLAKVSVRVNDKLAKVFKKPKRGTLKTQLELTGQPRTRVKVAIRTVTTTGKVATRTQYFVTCIPKGQSGR